MRTRSLESLRGSIACAWSRPSARAGPPAGRRSRVTGLSRSTVSSLVCDLQAHGLIVEQSDPDASAGMAPGARRSCSRSTARRGAVVGIDFGHDRIHVAVSDLSRTVLAEAVTARATSTTTPRARSTPPPAWSTSCSTETGRAADVIGVGMALAGPIDHDRGACRTHGDPSRLGRPGGRGRDEPPPRPPGAPRQRREPGRARRGHARRRPGDARTRLRDGRPGIGAGLIVDGRPYRGQRGTAGELGHVLVDEPGRSAAAATAAASRPCRRPAITDLLRRSRGEDLTLPRHRGSHARATPAAGARSPTPAARSAACSPLCNVLNPETVVVGGDLAEAGDVLLDPMRESVQRSRDPPAAEDARSLRASSASAPRCSARSPWPSSQSGRTRGATPRWHEGPMNKTRRRDGAHAEAVCGGHRLAMMPLRVPAALRRRRRGRRRQRGRGAGEGRQGRRPAAGLEVVGALGDGRPAVPQEGVRRRRRRVEIQNAEGDKSTQQQQAEQAITNGAKVILLVNLDSGSGAAIAANAKSQGVKVIDYDRLTLETDATRLLRVVRQREGRPAPGPGPRGLPRRQEAPPVAVLNGSPTDNNATLFKKGYDSVLNPKFDVRRLERGRRPVRARLGQPEGADDLRADAAEGQQQDRRRARGQRRPRQRGDLGAQAAQARRRSRSPARTRRCRASRTSSPATSA